MVKMLEPTIYLKFGLKGQSSDPVIISMVVVASGTCVETEITSFVTV